MHSSHYQEPEWKPDVTDAFLTAYLCEISDMALPEDWN